MLFENAKNTKKQGDIGESRAIYEYTLKGWVVCKPLCDSAKYDLIVERDGVIKRIQVKTGSFSRDGKYEVTISTKGGNRSFTTIQNRVDGDYDELFVLIETGECWMIPESVLPKTCIVPQAPKFSQYRV